MVDAKIRTAKIPISEIDSVLSDGTILLRYRIRSKDKNKNSHWSKIHKVELGTSFSELNGYLLPTLTDNHPTSAVTYSSSTDYMQSEITRSKVGSNVFTYSWTPKNTYATTKNYDVYLSWKDAVTNWTDWEFAGTTSANSFSFQRPSGNTSYQFVQAAVTVSAFPKLTNIGDNSGINILLSLSPILYIFYSVSGTVASAAGPDASGFYTATVNTLSTGFQALSSANNNNGIAITAEVNGGSFGSGQVTVTARPSATSITVRSNSAFTNGTVSNIKA